MFSRLIIPIFLLASQILLANTSPEGIRINENGLHLNSCTLPAPSGLTVTGVTPTSLAFGWLPVSGTNGYGVLLVNTNTGDPVYGDHIFTESTNITGLEPNTLYRFDVWTICPITGEPGGTSSIYARTDFVVVDDIEVNFQLQEPIFVPGNNFPLFNGTNNSEPSKFFEVRNNATGISLVFEAVKDLTPRSGDVVSHHVVFKNQNGEKRDPNKWIFDVDQIVPYCPDLCKEEGHYAFINYQIGNEHTPVVVMITPRTASGFTSLIWEPIVADYEVRQVSPSLRSQDNPLFTDFERPVVVQPNPFTDRMILRQQDFISVGETCAVTLLNPYTGAAISQHQWSADSDLIIPTTDLLPGAYLLRCETSDRTEVIKVIKSF